MMVVIQWDTVHVCYLLLSTLNMTERDIKPERGELRGKVPGLPPVRGGCFYIYVPLPLVMYNVFINGDLWASCFHIITHHILFHQSFQTRSNERRDDVETVFGAEGEDSHWVLMSFTYHLIISWWTVCMLKKAGRGSSSEGLCAVRNECNPVRVYYWTV